MIMSTFDNGPALDGWKLPPRCCGTWSSELTCSVCGMWMVAMPANIELGSE